MAVVLHLASSCMLSPVELHFPQTSSTKQEKDVNTEYHEFTEKLRQLFVELVYGHNLPSELHDLQLALRLYRVLPLTEADQSPLGREPG